MKITAVFLLVCLAAGAAAPAQTVTLAEKQAPLEKVLEAIKKQSGYTLFYKYALVKEKGKPVNVNIKNVPVEAALNLVFRDQVLTFELVGTTIIIKEKEVAKELVAGGLNPRLDPAPPPSIDVTITVLNTDNQPLEGASIIIKGSNKGIATDVNGRANLRGVDANATMIISFTGYASQEYKLASNPGLKSGVNNPTPVVIRLVVSANELNEVIVNKGYYTEKQRLSTSNVFSVKAGDIEKQPVSDPLLALQGRVPGLFITQSNGLPGSSIKVRIQGQNSIAKGNDPLYVIDGVPFTSQLLVGVGIAQGASFIQNGVASYGSPFSYLNPSDIESIEVLKDADATAIYGSRAANGAILITTKKGKATATRLDMNLQQGFGRVSKRADVLNREEYLQMRREAIKNDGATIGATDYDLNGAWDTTKSTDWQKELIGGTAKYTDMQAGISGGSANVQFLVKAGYHRETTVFPGDFDEQKGSLHFNITSRSNNDRFRLQLSGNYIYTARRLMYGDIDITQYALTRSPVAPPLYNSDGSLNWAVDASGNSTVDNPLAYLLKRNTNHADNLISNAVMSYDITPSLQIKTNLGFTNLQVNDLTVQPLTASAPEYRSTTPRGSQYANNNIRSWVAEPQISYKKKIGVGTIDGLVGSTFYKINSDALTLYGTGYASDLVLDDIKSAATVSVARKISNTYKYNALFARLNYNFQNKYIVNLTARRDGSSRFGEKNQFHNFGSVGLGWVLSDENFFKRAQKIVDFAKLRISYGTTGNDQIGDYQFMNLYTPTNANLPYQTTRGITVTGPDNPLLQWEETRKLQAGLDLSLIHGKINISSTFFINRSSNQLVNYLMPITTGFNTMVRNLPATVQNSGLELFASVNILSMHRFDWKGSLNLTLPYNKLIAFPNIGSSPYANTYIVGQPITSIMRFRFAGVDPQSGVYQFFDASGNITQNPAASDLTKLINTAPKFYGGFQNSLSFGNFDMDFLIQFTKQVGANSFHFGNYPGGGSYYGTTNQPRSILNRWQQKGDNASFQRFNADYSLSNQFDGANNSDAAFEDASFLRLKNISFAWNFIGANKKRFGFSAGKIYINAQNVFTITKYRGLDPESLSALTLPPLRVITFGIQFGF